MDAVVDPVGLLSGPAATLPERLPALVDAGCSLAYVRVHGMSPLLYCCAAYDEDLAIRLLREGVDVDLNASDQSGFTPLHYAADAGLERLARELLALGCDTEARNDDIVVPFGPPVPGGKAPLHLAACRGDEAMLELLLDGGAKLSQLDIDGNCALALACMHGQSRAASVLADRASRHTTEALPSLNMSPEEASRKLAADQRAASARLQMLSTPSGALLVVHRERAIWSAHQCEELLAAVTAAVDARGGEWETKRHTAYATTDLPAIQLLLPAYRALCQQLHAELLPLLGSRFGFPPATHSYTLRDLFFVKYEVDGNGAQADLPLHQDGSLVSFNILLNPATDFEGGGTFFEATATTYLIEQGDALFHCGGLRHAAAPITSGLNLNDSWLYLINMILSDMHDYLVTMTPSIISCIGRQHMKIGTLPACASIAYIALLKPSGANKRSHTTWVFPFNCRSTAGAAFFSGAGLEELASAAACTIRKLMTENRRRPLK